MNDEFNVVDGWLLYFSLVWVLMGIDDGTMAGGKVVGYGVVGCV